MSYSIIDIIDKAILITRKKGEYYSKLSEENIDNKRVKIFSDVLAKETLKYLDYYYQLKDKTEKDKLDEIEFYIYDKISFLISEFNSKMTFPKINNSKELLLNSIKFEKEMYALFIDVQGRIVKNEIDTKRESYRIMGEIIRNKKAFIENLEKLLKG